MTKRKKEANGKNHFGMKSVPFEKKERSEH
jgi:hypothetical protein